MDIERIEKIMEVLRLVDPGEAIDQNGNIRAISTPTVKGEDRDRLVSELTDLVIGHAETSEA